MFLSRDSRVFVVVLNYRNAGDTIRCLASLRRSRYRGLHPVIVDNGSPPATVDRLQHALGPTIPLLSTGANLGYAGGNNVGIRHALERDADFIWILNPDTEVEPGTLHLLLAAAALRPDAGVVGPVNLLGESQPPVVQSAGGRIDWACGADIEVVGRGKPFADIEAKDPYEVDYVTGASMLVRRRVLEEVGLLPEEYFLYFEETDFQVQAARHGWKMVVNPLARVRHHQRSGGELPAPYYVYYYIRGRILFGKRFAAYRDEELIAGLAAFVTGWRNRISRYAPQWLPEYDRLVTTAIADGRAGRTGPRPDIDTMVQVA